MLSLFSTNAIFCRSYLDVFLSRISRINKQFVWPDHQPRVIISEFNNVIKELLNVKYKFASMPVLDLADIVFSIESLCTKQSLLLF